MVIADGSRKKEGGWWVGRDEPPWRRRKRHRFPLRVRRRESRHADEWAKTIAAIDAAEWSWEVVHSADGSHHRPGRRHPPFREQYVVLMPIYSLLLMRHFFLDPFLSGLHDIERLGR